MKPVGNSSSEGAGASVVGGNLFNYGSFTFGNGAAQLQIGGDLNNEAGADLQFLPYAALFVTGQISNAGNVTFQLADVELDTNRTLANSGTWNLTLGSYTNYGTTSNAAGGVISLSSGDFNNWNQVNNDGDIRLTAEITTTSRPPTTTARLP